MQVKLHQRVIFFLFLFLSRKNSDGESVSHNPFYLLCQGRSKGKGLEGVFSSPKTYVSLMSYIGQTLVLADNAFVRHLSFGLNSL